MLPRWCGNVKWRVIDGFGGGNGDDGGSGSDGDGGSNGLLAALVHL